MSKFHTKTSFLGGSARHERVLPSPQIAGLNTSSRHLDYDIPYQTLGISKIEFYKLPPEGKALYLMAATTFLVAGVLPGLQGGVDIDQGSRQASGDNHTGSDIFNWNSLDHNDRAALSGISLVISAYEKVDPLIANTHQIEVNTAAKVMRIKTEQPLGGGISQLAQLKNDVDTEKGVPLSERILNTYLMANHFYQMKDGSYAHIGFTESGSMAVNKGFTLEQAKTEASLPKFIGRVKDAAAAGFWQDQPIAPPNVSEDQPGPEGFSGVPADRIMPLNENFGDPVIQGDIVRLTAVEDVDPNLQGSINQALKLFDDKYAEGRQYEPFRFSANDAFGNTQHVFISAIQDSSGQLITPTPEVDQSIPLSEPGNWYFYVEANDSGQLVPPGSGELGAGGLWIPLRAWENEGQPVIIYYGISIPAENAAGEIGEVHTPIFSFEGLPDGKIKFTFIDPFSDETFSTTNPLDNEFFASQTASLDSLIGLPVNQDGDLRTVDDNGDGQVVQVFEKGEWVDMNTKIPDTIWGGKPEGASVVLKDGEALLQMELNNFQTADGSTAVDIAEYNKETGGWDVKPFSITRLSLDSVSLYAKNNDIKKLDVAPRIDIFASRVPILGFNVAQNSDGMKLLDVMVLYKGHVRIVSPDTFVSSIVEADGLTYENRNINFAEIDIQKAMDIVRMANENHKTDENRRGVGYLYFTVMNKGASQKDCRELSIVYRSEQFISWCESEIQKGESRKIPLKDNIDWQLLNEGNPFILDEETDLALLTELWNLEKAIIPGAYFQFGYDLQK